MFASTPRGYFSCGLVLAVTAILATLGYELNWIRERHAMVRRGEVIDLVGSTTTNTREVFEKQWALEGRSSATAPGLLWLFGEPAITELRIFIEDYDASVPCEQYEVSQRALRLFPEARPSWACTILNRDAERLSAL
jgi:hypothetical protein